MRKSSVPRVLLVSSSGVALLLACGSRTGLPPGRVLGTGGSDGTAGTAPMPACVTDMDCPQPPPGQCGSAACNNGVCSLDLGQMCDDGNPCTVDSCVTGGCVFTDGRVDADGDGAFATGTMADPMAALGCGKDCNDAAPNVFPGAVELCDGIDNDCNGVIDDGTTLRTVTMAPTRVSPLTAEHADGTGLAFDGTSFGATMTSYMQRSQGQFQELDARGNLISTAQQIERVNAEAYGGPLVWSGERYLTAYQDARQDGNYEIYFDLLNHQGQRLIEDLRVTNADNFSLSPSVLWTGAEALLVWDDRRFEGTGDASAVFGQRVSIEGQLLGANVRLSPPGIRAESSSAALSADGVGLAFLALDSGQPALKFMTVSRSLGALSPLTSIDFDQPDGPVVTALNDEYVITFHQNDGSIVGPAIFGAIVNKNGVVSAPRSMTSGGAHARGNATYSYGDRFAMVWADDKDGTYQLYAQTFDQKLAPLSARLRLTTTMSNTLGPIVTPSTDGGLGVLYTDEGTGKSQAFFTRLDCQSATNLK